MDVTLRRPAADDLDAIYAICVRTADAGRDARDSYADHRLVGDIYAVPYAVLIPDWCWVAVDAEGVCGYVVGAPDTRAFETELERSWWPALRRRHPDPEPPPHANADAVCIYRIHAPETAPDDVLKDYPGHMHMNVLERTRGQGIGRRLFNAWCERAAEKGVRGVYVGVTPRNRNGAAFWQACGMAPIYAPDPFALPTFFLGRRFT